MEEEDLIGDEDRNRYAGQMERVKLRIDEARRLLDELRDERGLVYAAAQLRLALEEIAFASLISNRRTLEEAERSVALHGWDKASKSLRAINPDYWPRGVVEVRGDENEWLDAIGGLAEPEVAKSWGRLSQLLHGRNPWRDPLDFLEEGRFMRELIERLRVTLSSHTITLVGGRQKLFCQVWSHPVRVYLFGLVDGNDAPSPA